MTVYKPRGPQPSRPVQFICESYPNGGGIATDGEAGYHRFSTLSEIIGHLFKLHGKKFVIYSMLEGAKLVDATTGGLWEVFHWNGRVSHHRFAKTIKIFPIGSISQDVESLLPFFFWLREVGITPASFTTMARVSWERSLLGKVSFFDKSKMGRYTLYGGRKEAARGIYFHQGYQDLRSAFPSTMADNLFPRSIQESSRMHLYEYGYALATVRIPKGLSWNPIPCRLGKFVICYGYGEHTDWWTTEDLKHVITCGGQVKVHRSFRAHDKRPVFKKWWYDLIYPAREELSGDALQALKTLANRLWSGFAIGGTQKISEWTEDSKRRVITRRTEIDHLRHESYIAALVQAMVRTRVLNALYKFPEPIYVDTDGIICALQGDAGDGWREKRRMREVQIHSCGNFQWYCYRCGVMAEPYCDDGNPHYNLSVVTNSRREAARIIANEHLVPVNPLFGITVPALDNMKELRRKHRYAKAAHIPSPDAIDWREGSESLHGKWREDIPLQERLPDTVG